MAQISRNNLTKIEMRRLRKFSAYLGKFKFLKYSRDLY